MASRTLLVVLSRYRLRVILLVGVVVDCIGVVFSLLSHPHVYVSGILLSVGSSIIAAGVVALLSPINEEIYQKFLSLDPVSLLKARFPYKRLVRFGEISPETKRLSSYLLYEDMESNRYLFLTGELPSQYMRKLLAEILGKSEWDWRSAEREERLLSTLDRLSSYLETIGSRSAVQSIHNAGDS